MATRIEVDSMGEVPVPADAMYGAETARAVANFPISGGGIGREMIRALGLIKRAAAEVNGELGLLTPELAAAIARAAGEVANGTWDDHFPVDVFQTGSGTSSHMNANEVIANRAAELLGGARGDRHLVHPNDHVNRGQSSNDVVPSAIHVAAVCELEERLLPALGALAARLDGFGRANDVVKVGRTHLQDATPIRLGQVFAGYAAQLRQAAGHLGGALEHLRQLAIGGTAVGTGLNTHPEFGGRVARVLAMATGRAFVEAPNHVAAQSSQDAAVQASGALRTTAVALMKIANDIRWLGSGPRLGLGELAIPAVQPGSSIMPGKVNPVIAESLVMVCAQVIGNDAAIAVAGMSGHFELNAMLPLVARNLLEQIRLLTAAVGNFDQRLVCGLAAEASHIEERVERSLAMATALAPRLGYDAAADIAKEARDTGKTVREVARARGVLPDAELASILDPRRQTEPGV